MHSDIEPSLISVFQEKDLGVNDCDLIARLLMPIAMSIYIFIYLLKCINVQASAA